MTNFALERNGRRAVGPGTARLRVKWLEKTRRPRFAGGRSETAKENSIDSLAIKTYGNILLKNVNERIN